MSEAIDRTLDLPRTGFGFLHHHDENDQVIAVQALRVRAGLRRQRRRHHRPWPKLSLWFVDPEGMRIEVDWVRDPSLRGFHTPKSVDEALHRGGFWWGHGFRPHAWKNVG